MHNVIGIDLGTSSVKVLQRFADGTVCKARSEYPEPGVSGWRRGICQALGQLDLTKTQAVGLSSQVGTYIVDGETVISWQNAAGKEELKELCTQFTAEDFLREISMPHPQIHSYPLPRLMYIKKHYPQVKTVWQPKELICKMLTGAYVTDRYSWRGLCCLETGRYSSWLLEKLGIDEKILPPVKGHADIAGRVTPQASAEFGLPEGIPVYTGLNDYFASLLGMGICQPGQLFDITGTSEHLGILETRIRPETPLVSGPYLQHFVHYGVTGSAGASLSFARTLSENIPPMEQVFSCKPPVFLPYLQGERAPIWDPNARGVFFGLEAGCTRESMAYAVLEGVAFSLYHNYETMGKPRGESMVISGGAAANDLLCRLKAELFDLPVKRLAEPETSALGACMVALTGQGMSVSEATQCCVKTEQQIAPTGAFREKLLQRYSIYKQLYPALKDSFLQLGEIK